MTAHQDVAGVVERLRSNPHGLIHVDTRAGINEPTNMIRDAATLIESISKALSEAEAKYAKIEKATAEEWFCGACGEVAFVGIRDYAAVQSRLAEAMSHLQAMHRYASRNEAGPEIDAALAFLNAGKE